MQDLTVYIKGEEAISYDSSYSAQPIKKTLKPMSTKAKKEFPWEKVRKHGK